MTLSGKLGCLVAIVIHLIAQGVPARAGDADSQKMAVLIAPFRSEDDRYLGLAAAHVLEQAITLHPGLEECRACQLKDEAGAMDAFLDGRGDVGAAAERLGVRYWMSGRVRHVGQELEVDAVLHDRGTKRVLSRTLPLDYPGLEKYRAGFADLLREAGLGMPDEQRTRMLWKETLTLDALRELGRGLAQAYVSSFKDGSILEKALTMHPDSYLLAEAVGRLRRLQGRTTEAGELLLRAIQANPHGASAARELARCDGAERRKDAAIRWAVRFGIMRGTYAIELLEELLTLFVGNPDEDPVGAGEFFERLLGLQKDEKDQVAFQVTTALLATMAYARASRYARALPAAEEAAALARSVPDRSVEAATLDLLGLVYGQVGLYEKALRCAQAAGSIHRDLNDHAHEGANFRLLGQIYLALGQKARAVETLERYVAWSSETRDGQSLMIGLVLLGYAYDAIEQFEKAFASFETGLKAAREAGERMWEITALNGLAYTFLLTGKHARAVEPCDQALRVARESKWRHQEGSVLVMLSVLYASTQQYEKAARCAEQGLVIARETDDRENEALMLAALMALTRARSPHLAILYGKLAINVWQSLRADMEGLDKELRSSFLKGREKAYRALAELLISQGRIPEATQVIDLLKEQEYHRAVRSEPTAPGRAAAFTSTEEAWRQQYGQLVTRLGTVGAAYDALDTLRAKRTLTSEEKQRLRTLQGELDAAQQAYAAFVAEVSQSVKQAADTAATRISQLQSDENLKALLADLGEHSVVLYTLMASDACHVILITPSFQEVFSSRTGSAALGRQIVDFRESLQTTSADPRPAARALYDTLLGQATDRTGRVTLAARLREYGATTLMWELDGPLRYAPVAALYDGRQYLAESYCNVVFTPASKVNLREAPDTGGWKALGLGVSRAQDGFRALASVEAELSSLIDEILPGTILLNDRFTQDAMRDALLDDYRVVHIASHFSFKPGKVEQSFLLIGRGTPPHLTVGELARWGSSPFRHVDLLTLSACNTAMGGDAADGKEVENFAVAAQNKGARAVLATLWEVDDPSTRSFMKHFYGTLRKEKLSKAAALQRAQLALLRGTAVSESGTPRGSAVAVRSPLAHKWSHPYYWAPFVLMGNWK